MTKKEFMDMYNSGVSRGRQFMVVQIETEGNPGPEVIVNRAENFAMKIKYYDKAYNDNMELIKAKEAGKSIRITDLLMTNNLNDLNWFIF